MYTQLGKCVFEVIDRMGDLTGGDEAIQLCLELVELTNPIFNKYLPVKGSGFNAQPKVQMLDDKIGELMRGFLEDAMKKNTNFDTWGFGRAVASMVNGSPQTVTPTVIPCTCFDEAAKRYCMNKGCSKIEMQSHKIIDATSPASLHSY
jgi:hypothetical protein